MKRFRSLPYLTALLLTLANCGGAGAPPATSQSLSDQAMSLLSQGDIAGAKASYDSALSLDGNNTQAAFGAAFTRVLFLGESVPSQNILSLFGQPSAKLSNVFGPDGYLAALNEVNQSQTAFDGISGPFYGVANTNDNTRVSYLYDQQARTAYFQQIASERDACLTSCAGDIVCEDACRDAYWTKLDDQSAYTSTVDCTGKTIYFQHHNADSSITLEGGISLTVQAAKDGNVLSNFQWNVGETIDASQRTPDASGCGGSPVLNLWVQSKDQYFNTYDGATGSFTLVDAGHNPGENLQVKFSNITLSNGGDETITLNGIVSDTITLPKSPKPVDYLPLFKNEGHLPKKAALLSQARDDFKISDGLNVSRDYVPLIEEIRDLLERADRDDGFQFIIPKGLYFGHQDVALNRTDLKLFRAGFEFAQMALHLASSWDCPMQIGDLYNEEGNLAVSKQEIVDRLNTCFVLRPDHKLEEARTRFVQGIRLVLDADDISQQITADGVIDASDRDEAAFAELRDAAITVQASLEGAQDLDFSNPLLTLDMGAFFSNPPDASQIESDAFVLEDDKIKPVEAFWTQFASRAINIDFTKKYDATFASATKVLAQNIFSEFRHFTVSGRDVGFKIEP